MSEAWASLLLGSRDAATAAVLHTELQALEIERPHSDVTLLCKKLDELTTIAQRRSYDVPEEIFLTVSMGIELLGYLVDNPRGGVDLAGFVVELDAVLRDARLLPDPTARLASSSVPNRTPPPASRQPSGEAPDHLCRATRARLARAATTLYLEAVRASGPSALRLRETWGVLRAELVALGRVSLQAHLLPQLLAIEQRDDARLKNVHVTAAIEDVIVSKELAEALGRATLRLVDHAIADGVEAPSERARRGKPTKALVRVDGRIVDGRVVVVVEDDGAGVDVTAVTRAALSSGLLPNGELVDEQRALAVLFDRRWTAAGLGGAVDLAAVRDAFAREDGSVRLRTALGRGSVATLSIPNATTVKVRTFRSPLSSTLFAVDASWSLEPAAMCPTSRLDLIGALGLRTGIGAVTSRRVTFGRGDLAFELDVRATPTLNVATRLFPPDPDSASEVVLVGDTEALLIRPDLLARSRQQSTVPPPAVLTVVPMAAPTMLNERDYQPTLRPAGPVGD